MPRLRTLEPDDAPTATKKMLRAISKKRRGDGTWSTPICNDMVGMIESFEEYTATGDVDRAAAVTLNLKRSSEALKVALATPNDQ